MATEASGSHPSGAVAEVKDKGEELVSAAQEQITAKAHELGGEANFQIREQLDQRSTQAGEQVQSMGKALQSGVDQLRSEGKDVPARVVEQVARRADDLGAYLQSAQADRMLRRHRAICPTPSVGDGRRRCPRRIPRLTVREGLGQSSLRGRAEQRQRLFSHTLRSLTSGGA